MKKLFLCVATVLLLLSGCSNVEKNIDFKVEFLNVGHADAALISCNGHHMLIDCGENPYKIQNILLDEGRSISALDYIIFTHSDNDHVGGFDGVLDVVKNEDKYNIGKIYVNQETESILKQKLIETKIPYSIPKTNQTIKLAKAEIKFLSVDDVPTSNTNNHSIIVMISCGNNKATRVLMMGDAEYDLEEHLLDQHKKGKIDLTCDVLKVAHHGSNTSTQKEFLEIAKPTYAIISVGNKYGLPSNEVITNLKSKDITYYTTIDNGNITVSGADKEISVVPDHDWDLYSTNSPYYIENEE